MPEKCLVGIKQQPLTHCMLIKTYQNGVVPGTLVSTFRMIFDTSWFQSDALDDMKNV